MKSKETLSVSGHTILTPRGFSQNEWESSVDKVTSSVGKVTTYIGLFQRSPAQNYVLMYTGQGSKVKRANCPLHTHPDTHINTHTHTHTYTHKHTQIHMIFCGQTWTINPPSTDTTDAHTQI